MELHLGMKTRRGLGDLINFTAIVATFIRECLGIARTKCQYQAITFLINFTFKVISPKWLTLSMPNIKKMTKDTLKTLRCEHRKIFKVSLGIFQRYT